jgi:DNA-directed RNA polymerase subunit RPC12/RpoP
MTEVATRCAHCEAPIVDTATQVLHGSQLFCCANCSHAMEQVTGGTAPTGPSKENDIRCERCTSPIVDDSTMVQEGDRIFCCGNCAAAARG